jgi:hypothetical protein
VGTVLRAVREARLDGRIAEGEELEYALRIAAAAPRDEDGPADRTAADTEATAVTPTGRGGS